MKDWLILIFYFRS